MNKTPETPKLPSEKDIKTTMKAIFESISKSMSKDVRANPLYKYMKANEEWFGDPEEMHTMIICPFHNIIDELVKGSIENATDLVYGIYEDWDFFDQNVTELCKYLYGYVCCADRGRFIVKSAMNWAITGELPVFDPKPENFHHPETGTPEQWMNFVEGIYALKYGHPAKYLKAYKELIVSNAVL